MARTTKCQLRSVESTFRARNDDDDDDDVQHMLDELRTSSQLALSRSIGLFWCANDDTMPGKSRFPSEQISESCSRLRVA